MNTYKNSGIISSYLRDNSIELNECHYCHKTYGKVHKLKMNDVIVYCCPICMMIKHYRNSDSKYVELRKSNMSQEDIINKSLKMFKDYSTIEPDEIDIDSEPLEISKLDTCLMISQSKSNLKLFLTNKFNPREFELKNVFTDTEQEARVETTTKTDENLRIRTLERFIKFYENSMKELTESMHS